MGNLWKENWEETKQHYINWWEGKGSIIIPGYIKGDTHEDIQKPIAPDSLKEQCINPEYRANSNRYDMSQKSFIGDILPFAYIDVGPGTLSTFLGSEPEFRKESIWFLPCIDDPESAPELKFSEENKWWQNMRDIISANVKAADGNYFVGCPDLIENIDTLASLRGTQKLLLDMIERPEWVKTKIKEINKAWFQAYQHIYDLIKLEDGSSIFGAFSIWGPGKTAKIQCDANMMFSPDMFKEFVIPDMTEQCDWLDYSMFHLDGSEGEMHLDHLLSIDSLTAIEFTPEPTKPRGHDLYWTGLYKRILEGGKSLQIVMAQKQGLKDLFNAIGTKGVYVIVDDIEDEQEYLEICNSILGQQI